MPLYIDELRPVRGDPAGMRAKASALLVLARSIRELAGQVSREAASMTFRSDAGDRFRSRMSKWRQRATSVADRLESAAADLRRSAHEVERQQAERDAYYWRMRQLALDAQRRAQGGS